MKTIVLYAGKAGNKRACGETLVSDEDYDYLSQFMWRITHGYVVAYGRAKGRSNTYMHRVVLSRVIGNVAFKTVDHINCDKLDNRRENLRPATQAENLRNQGKQRHNTSGYKGVSYDKRDKRWRAFATFNKKQVSFGYHAALPEAIEAHKAGVLKLHGEFART